MKTADEVRNRVVELLEAELDRRVAVASERLPYRCVHNHRQPVQSRRNLDGEENPTFNRVSRSDSGRALPVLQSIGLCMLEAEDPTVWKGTICDDPVDAKRCPYFTPAQDKAALFGEFTEQLTDATWVRENLPEVHALLWVLELMQIPRISWWKRLWFRFMQIKIEEVQPPFDPSKLLPETSDTARS